MILLVDDDKAITASLGMFLKREGYETRKTDNPHEALNIVSAETVDLVIQDMNFTRSTSGEEGLELLGRIKKCRPDLPVILMTAWGTIELAVAGMRAGASDFVTKPWSSQQLLHSIKTVLSLADWKGETHARRALTRAEYDQELDLEQIIGESAELLKVFDVIRRVCRTDASVLIMGESGTGKEIVAEVLHKNSQRSDRPFIKVNLGGISSSLFESEMFGHVRGAFTDALSDRRGRFEMADRGTIFLDEIGDLDASSQVKLLRVLQDRTFEALGSSVTRSADVRVVSATNRNLGEMVKEGLFREDLLYRLNLITLSLPPLRQRSGDIPLLSRYFLHRSIEKYCRGALQIEKEALDWLSELQWPGNVRQLSQLIERTVLVCSTDRLGIADFRFALEMESSETSGQLPDVGLMSLEDMEKAMIVRALEYHNGHISRAAESLGLSRPAVYRRMEKFGIKV